MSIKEVNTVIQQKQEDGSYAKLYPVTKIENVKDADGKDLNEVLEDKAQKEHQHDYASDIPSTAEVGGIEKGFTTEGMSVEEILFKLLHKYVAPGVNLSSNPNGGVYEIGATIDSVDLTATGIREADMIERIRFYKNNEVVETINNTSNAGNVIAEYTESNITTNTTFKADVYDGKTTITSGNISFNFVRPLYIGSLAADVTAPTEEQIKAMTKRVVARSNQSMVYTIDNERLCIACPPGWTLQQIIDTNGFNITGAFAEITVPVTCLDGTTQDYNVYLSAPTSQNGFTVKYNV